ncbi:MAG: TIGR01212 family radical SAM protein, partial [Bacteroidales bacterium]|nr:TIGR01212 family radical SAM protein [Bacteroidales bacterium]
YFQAYSNTYAPLERLRDLYEEALRYPGVTGLVIGTRPDCVDDEKIEYISGLARKHYIAVEYGIESCYDKTLSRINRQHSFEEAVNAVKKTVAGGINTGAHFIFGLPGETRQEMLDEAAAISKMPLTTVKFHQLQIMKGTVMEKEYREHPDDFLRFSMDEYISFIIEFLERLNPAIVVERFTGEAPPRFLAEIAWDKTRTEQLGIMIEKRMEELDTWQGRLFKTTVKQDGRAGGHQGIRASG